MAVNERTRPLHLGNRPAERMKAKNMQTKGLSKWTGRGNLERVMGIEPTSSAWKAADILDIPESEADRFLRRQIAACNCAFEIIQTTPADSFQSSMPQLGPEWMADLMASAANACPALTPDAMLHGTPLVLLIHLAAAAHRKNGGTTRRPSDDAAAVRLLQSFHQSK